SLASGDMRSVKSVVSLRTQGACPSACNAWRLRRLEHETCVLTQRVKAYAGPVVLCRNKLGCMCRQESRRFNHVVSDAMRIAVDEAFQLALVVARHPSRKLVTGRQKAG